MICASIMLQDEIPAIGTGLRHVFAHVGHKWVSLIYPPMARTVRIHRRLWDDLAPSASLARPSTLARILRRAITDTGREPTRLERVALALEGEK
jgi:hypothetical protein